jgi:hypothetical protein
MRIGPKVSTISLFLLLAWASQTQAAVSATHEALFRKVFGGLIDLDPETRERVLAGEPGQRHWIDTDNDGKPQEVWFIDTASRHPEEMRPLLVRAVDEDGDLDWNEEPDLDSDLYLADWKADGSVDAAVDYTDLDGDGDVDEMGLFFYDERGGGLGEPVIRVWWSRDVGDDNLLWFDAGYHYSQPLCQLRTHFGGDEVFVAFALKEEGREWIPFWENPFQFYDHDFDGVAEEVFRNSGVGSEVSYLRHSFDADNDATWDSPRDFDVSLTAHATAELTFPSQFAETILIRGIPTGPFLSFLGASEFSKGVTWERMMLTWDEDDNNVDLDNFLSEDERWEGVIADGTDEFKQVGGPSVGPFNKRYELAIDPEGPAEFYYHPTDQRIHLKGADKAWLLIDLDQDRQVDMRYDMFDSDGDGILDRWTFDADADGKAEDTWDSQVPEAVELGWNWAEVSTVMTRVLARIPQDLFTLNERLGKAVYSCSENPPSDPVTQFFRNGFQTENIDADLARKYLSSNESMRFFLNLHKDHLIWQLKQCYDKKPFWAAFDLARGTGNMELMGSLLAREFQLKPESRPLENWRNKQLFDTRPREVAWAEDWVPPNIGWESDKVAYRAYWGQFDFFGKKWDGPRFIYPDIGARSYHEETDWGIDALLVGNTGGSGGVTLHVNGESFPVRSPEGKGEIVFTKRLVEETADRVTVEMKAEKVGPEAAPYTVTFLCSALADRADTPILVTVEGGQPGDELALGVGLIKLPTEEVFLDTRSGVLASWGVQDPAVIGTIGMGVLFPPDRFEKFLDLEQENQVVLEIQAGQPVGYHLQCDWLRGRRFSHCPTGEDWFEELREKAGDLGL